MSKRDDDIDSKIFKSTISIIVFSILSLIVGIMAWPTLFLTVPFLAFNTWVLINEIKERNERNK